jgi:hypothetical protein
MWVAVITICLVTCHTDMVRRNWSQEVCENYVQSIVAQVKSRGAKADGGCTQIGRMTQREEFNGSYLV